MDASRRPICKSVIDLPLVLLPHYATYLPSRVRKLSWGTIEQQNLSVECYIGDRQWAYNEPIVTVRLGCG